MACRDDAIIAAGFKPGEFQWIRLCLSFSSSLGDASTRPKFAKDNVRVDETASRGVFVRISQSLMKRGSVFFIEPVPRIEGQELDLGSFREIGRLVDDKSPGLDSSLQRHAITVAPRPLVHKPLSIITV